MDDAIAKIEETLGHRLLPSDKQRIQDLNEVPVQLIEEARSLPLVLRQIYFRHYIADSERSHLSRFIDDVVEGGESPELWGRGRLLIPDFEEEELVETPVEQILDVLPQPGELGWSRVGLESPRSEQRTLFVGAPAAHLPHVNYQWSRPPRTLNLRSKTMLVEQVADIVIATRRWIAANLASYAGEETNFAAVPSPEHLIRQVLPDAGTLTTDALIAARALLAERRQWPHASPAIPGYTAPDRWFTVPPSLPDDELP